MGYLAMLEKLEKLTKNVTALHSKLILLIGPPLAGKTALLQAFGVRAGAKPLNVGSELGLRLATIPVKQRHLEAGNILRELVNSHAHGDLVLLDNIELLFDRSLQLNPLELLKKHAASRRVVAVWPGEIQKTGTEPRLTYADLGHPEHQDCAINGLVPLELQ